MPTTVVVHSTFHSWRVCLRAKTSKPRMEAMTAPRVHSAVTPVCTPRASQRVTPGGTAGTQTSAPALRSWMALREVMSRSGVVTLDWARNGGTQKSSAAGSEG
ncbi:hypothetical protein GCM10010403_08490 [Glycomyces rutgersensis]|uniref:Uncharacterized protein n=1 Tax=Glycomyces rutgersensis TaxID=58115 RepID=A0ABP5S7E9_9ACTN